MTKKTMDKEYDFHDDLNEMEIPDYMKKGFTYHLNTNEIPIKSKSDLTKKYNEFIEGA